MLVFSVFIKPGWAGHGALDFLFKKNKKCASIGAAHPIGVKMEGKQEENKKGCQCTYPGCSRKGICCGCIRHHLANRELPGCCAENFQDENFAC